MRLIVILCAVAALVACDDQRSRHGNNTNIAFGPSEALSAQISPAVITLTTIATGTCATAVALTTSFDLIVIGAQQGDVFLDSVSLHLLDGSNLGGPSITFPSAQLTQMFGNTIVNQTRVFAFRPEFGCPAFRPGSIRADVTVIDRSGKQQKIAASATFR